MQTKMSQNQQLSLAQRVFVLLISLLPLAFSIFIGRMIKAESQLYFQIGLLAITVIAVIAAYIYQSKKRLTINQFYSFLFAFIFLIIFLLNSAISAFISVDSERFKMRSVLAIISICVFVVIRFIAKNRKPSNQ